jgi:hypothetical protein
VEFCAYSEEPGGRNTKVSSTLSKYCSDYDRLTLFSLSLYYKKVKYLQHLDKTRPWELLAELTADPTIHVISDCQSI